MNNRRESMRESSCLDRGLAAGSGLVALLALVVLGDVASALSPPIEHVFRRAIMRSNQGFVGRVVATRPFTTHEWERESLVVVDAVALVDRWRNYARSSVGAARRQRTKFGSIDRTVRFRQWPERVEPVATVQGCRCARVGSSQRNEVQTCRSVSAGGRESQVAIEPAGGLAESAAQR